MLAWLLPTAVAITAKSPRSNSSISVYSDSTSGELTSPDVSTGFDSKLRGCDLVSLKVRDVFAAGQVKDRASVTQSKTGKPVRFEITETTRHSLEKWIADPEMIGSEFLRPSQLHASPHLSTRQYARIMREWVTCTGLESSAYGTHSMRRTKVAQIYKKTGNLRAVQLLLGHTKMDSTVRYLGVDLDDALALSEGVDL